MTLLIICLFMIFIAITAIAYILATDKKSQWEKHTIDPYRLPEKKDQVDEGYHIQEAWSVTFIQEEFDDQV